MIPRRLVMKFITTLALVVTMLPTAGHAQAVRNSNSRKGENMLSTNECIAKGGIGILNTHLYLDLKSAKNELILDGGNRWAGQPQEGAEVVFFFENKVWSTNAVPQGFDLSKAIVISFERNIVRFFDFGKASGGYYKRPKE